MSVHRSKGLEFPVVVLADLQKKFNQQDMNRPVLVHPQLGLGTERVDIEKRIRYGTISKRRWRCGWSGRPRPRRCAFYMWP